MTPIERAARALGAIRFEDEVGTPPLRSILSEQELAVAVRSVIAAIQEPSEEMERAGRDAAWEGSDLNDGQPMIGAVFPAMIDALLEEGK